MQGFSGFLKTANCKIANYVTANYKSKGAGNFKLLKYGQIFEYLRRRYNWFNFFKSKKGKVFTSPFIFSDCMKLLFLSSVHDRFIWSSNWHFLPCTLFFCRKKRTKWKGAKGCNSHVMTNIMLQPKANLPRALHPRWTFYPISMIHILNYT